MNAGYVENALQRMLFGSQDIAARDKQGIGNRLCQRGVIFLQGINGVYRVIYAVRDLIAVVRLDYIRGVANVINPYLLVLLEALMETIIQQRLIKSARDILLKKIDELMP